MNRKINEFLIFLVISFGAVYVCADVTSGIDKTAEKESTVVKSVLPIANSSTEISKPEETKKSIVNTADSATGVPNITHPEVISLASSSISEETPKSLPTASIQPKASSTKSTASPSSATPQTTIPFSKPADLPVTSAPIFKNDEGISRSVQDLELGRWVIHNNMTNTTCIIAQMAMQLNITYPNTAGKSENTTINVPGKESVANGSCSNSSQSMTITWGPGHSLQINFGLNETAKDFYVSGLSLNVNASVFKNVQGNVTFINYTNQIPEFYTPLKMSYKCDKPQQVNLTSSSYKSPAVLTLTNTRFEAYMNASKPDFGEAQDCDMFDTPDIVPIAVGVALAILVLVVLVAYLIGRKRSQNRGYLSM